MPWLGKVQAVVEAWYAGNGGAEALARILRGDVDPSGRLPITFPQNESQLPHPDLPGGTWHSGSFDVEYSEGSDVGYRWFARQKLTALFPFGYGLSYSRFGISGLQASGGDTISASADVANSGQREGRETVEFFATPPGAVPRLIGWVKVDLKPGETRHVAIEADPRLLAHFDSDAQTWKIDAGSYAVSVGASSSDTTAPAAVTMAERRIKP
jgi:beta-glucosidase